MGFFGSFTGASQRKDQKSAYSDSNAMLDQGYGQAQGNLQSGYGRSESAYGQGRSDLGAGYGQATNALASSTNKAAGYLTPYTQSGQGANKLYSDALGVNGASAQMDFQKNYNNDPFRQANADFASNALMQQYNSRGMSGGGVAAQAVARENLRRGSDDYSNYLTRLQGASTQGQSAATGLSSLYENSGQRQASMDYGYGGDLANIQGQRANVGYQYGQNQAGLNTDLATGKAGNRINLGNSLANSRGILTNNLTGLAGMGLKAAGVGGYGIK